MTDVAQSSGGGHRLGIACGTLVAWVAVTIFGAGLRGKPVELEDMATQGIAWQIALAGVLLVCVIAWRGWRDLGFRAPAPGTLKLLWLPALIVLAMFGLAVVLGLPAPDVVLLVLANTLLVGFSEEVMFRGVLFGALRERLRPWPAILCTTGAFGLVHVLNGFLTGSFTLAVMQALAASCTGLMLMAILLRTGSLWGAILVHALWDCATFLVVLSAGAMADLKELQAAGGLEVTPGLLVVPLLIVLPNLVYGLWLLRGSRVEAEPRA
ncbi:CPBP family intramembrane metalloprotease [Yangia mangrovi]|uniref:CPBP family intramembrane metalloprotease n=1 Tax=Alloyangia mangrovi TaxID=1779329 RepID=A0A2A3JV21_9RHOB|nr:CPBP family intramembrane glutamic endopeptidase [Alloyangia mangrovi]MCT4370121.1 CPBP family intramembrane metalloprotease [Alloyangia mangrovi]